MNLLRNIILVLIASLCNSHSLLAAEYKVAVRAHHGIKSSVKQWGSTIDALTTQLPEHTFILVPLISLKQITDKAGRAEFDFLLTNPSSFVEIKKLYGANALATLNNDRSDTAQDSFGSVIFTHVRNVDILGINDLENKTLMIASEQAFGGWRIAWLEMIENGFDPYSRLGKLSIAKSEIQPEVVYAVRDGKADAGVVRTDRLERMETEGSIDMRYFRILNNKDLHNFPFFLSTKLYPEWPFSSLSHVPNKLGCQVADVLLSLSRSSQAAQAGKYFGWIPPRDYSSVRALMKRLEISPYEK